MESLACSLGPAFVFGAKSEAWHSRPSWLGHSDLQSIVPQLSLCLPLACPLWWHSMDVSVPADISVSLLNRELWGWGRVYLIHPCVPTLFHLPDPSPLPGLAWPLAQGVIINVHGVTAR